MQIQAEIEAIILAGGRSEYLPVPCKADLPIGGRPMVDYVAAALHPHVSRIHIARDAEPGARTTVLENLIRAVERHMPVNRYVLVSNCDIPFLTSEAVGDFLSRCEPGYDLYYPAVVKEACEEKFPGVSRTYAKLREGTFTGGNLFLLRPEALLPLADRVEQAFALRKSPLRLAGAFGPRFIGKFLLSTLFGNLSLADLETQVCRLTGLQAKVVVSAYPEIGTDIDKPSDLPLLDRLS